VIFNSLRGRFAGNKWEDTGGKGMMMLGWWIHLLYFSYLEGVVR
tara:strand:+ start:430 stop:561 length:132 start_codon:yes stop_codon:yes gene_type:complete